MVAGENITGSLNVIMYCCFYKELVGVGVGVWVDILLYITTKFIIMRQSHVGVCLDSVIRICILKNIRLCNVCEE